jgi:hypothetical protein
VGEYWLPFRLSFLASASSQTARAAKTHGGRVYATGSAPSGRPIFESQGLFSIQVSSLTLQMSRLHQSIRGISINVRTFPKSISYFTESRYIVKKAVKFCRRPLNTDLGNRSHDHAATVDCSWDGAGTTRRIVVSCNTRCPKVLPHCRPVAVWHRAAAPKTWYSAVSADICGRVVGV